MRGCEQSYQHGDGARHVIGVRLCELVLELERFAPLVVADAPDAVHGMRVTTRRLRSNLATFRPFLDRSVTDPLRDELKWFAELLGDARDTEVLWAGLVAKLEADPPELVGPGVRELVDDELGSHYRRAHDDCVAAMATPRYVALRRALQRLGEFPPWAETRHPHTELLLAQVRHDWRRLAHRVAALQEPVDEDVRALRRHEVRKAVKRVRYAAEPLVTSYGEPARGLVDAMKQVQTVLGDHQDAVVASRELIALREHAARQHIDAFELGRLHEQTRQDAVRTAATFEQVWREASHERYRSWL